MRVIVLDLNPEPWAIGPVGYARRNGKMTAYVGRNQQLDAFKEAVRGELGDPDIIEGSVVLHMYFWRNRADYKTPNDRKHRKNDADLTNMQKAFEDALQGIAIENDRLVRRVYSMTVEQGPDVIPRIVVGIEPFTVEYEVLPRWVNVALDQHEGIERAPEEPDPYDDDEVPF